MNEQLLEFKIIDDKLWAYGDGATEQREFYLPDCTELELREFMSKHVENAAAMLAHDRPWMPWRKRGNLFAELRGG